MKFAAAVIVALVGAAAASPHGQCGAHKSKHRHHSKPATSASTLSEIAAPTSVDASSSAIATSDAASSSAIPTAIVNVGPPPMHSHSFSFSFEHTHTFSSAHSRSTVVVTETSTAASATATETLSASSSAVVTDSSSSVVTDSSSVAAPTSTVSVAHTTSSSSSVAHTTSSSSSVAHTTSAAPTHTTTSSSKTTPPVVTPTSKTSTSSAAAPTTTPVSGSKAKRGLGFNYATDTAPFAGAVSWAYSWGSSYSGSLPAGVEFVPMLWTSDSSHTSSWDADVKKALDAGSTHLLGFNEPDLNTQANLTPEEAAAAWKQYMQPYAGQAKLVSPAVTNGGAPMGLAWMDAFLAACTGCSVDAIAIHIYDAASNAAYFQSYISGAAARYGKPVWVTEFGASGTTGAQQTFLGTMLPYLDNLSGVERYSYFGDFQGTMVQGNALTPLGQSYASN